MQVCNISLTFWHFHTSQFYQHFEFYKIAHIFAISRCHKTLNALYKDVEQDRDGVQSDTDNYPQSIPETHLV